MNQNSLLFTAYILPEISYERFFLITKKRHLISRLSYSLVQAEDYLFSCGFSFIGKGRRISNLKKPQKNRHIYFEPSLDIRINNSDFPLKYGFGFRSIRDNKLIFRYGLAFENNPIHLPFLLNVYFSIGLNF